MAVNNFTPLPRNTSCRFNMQILKVTLREWTSLRDRQYYMKTADFHLE